MILTWCPKFIPTLLCSCAPCQPVIPSYFGGLLCRWAPERREIRPIHIRYLLRGQIILITLDAVVRSIFTHLEKGAVPYVVAVPLGLLLLYYFFLCLSTFFQCCSCCFSDPEMPQHFPTTAPTTITQPPHQHSTTIDIPIRDAIQALETTQPPPQQPSPIHHHATPALQTTQLPPQDSSTTHHARRGLEGQARPLPAVLNATSTTPAATSDDIHIQTHYPHLFRQPSEKLVPAAHSSLAARTALKKLSSIIKHLMSDAQSTGQHHSKSKPVIKKAMVELEGMPFKKFAAMREEWAIKEGYNSPGPVQNIGPRANDVLQAEP